MIITLRRFALIISAAFIALVLTGCRPSVEGTYKGGVLNQSHGVSADLYITLTEYNETLSGNMTIGAPLNGGGSVSGRRDGKQIQFVTSDSNGGRISWYGEVSGRQIEGQYVVEPGGLGAFLAGAEKQQGVWRVKR